jgi:hypothetical protein
MFLRRNVVQPKRGSRYGKFTDHARLSQNLKWILFEHNDKSWLALAADQREAIEMICHKVACIVNGDPNYADSWRDIAGYAMLVAERLEGTKR